MNCKAFCRHKKTRLVAGIVGASMSLAYRSSSDPFRVWDMPRAFSQFFSCSFRAVCRASFLARKYPSSGEVASWPGALVSRCTWLLTNR